MIHSETREDARHVNSKSDFHGIFRYKYVEYRSLEGIEQGIPQVGAISQRKFKEYTHGKI